jgi:hypothetical protein
MVWCVCNTYQKYPLKLIDYQWEKNHNTDCQTNEIPIVALADNRELK